MSDITSKEAAEAILSRADIVANSLQVQRDWQALPKEERGKCYQHMLIEVDGMDKIDIRARFALIEIGCQISGDKFSTLLTKMGSVSEDSIK